MQHVMEPVLLLLPDHFLSDRTVHISNKREKNHEVKINFLAKLQEVQFLMLCQIDISIFEIKDRRYSLKQGVSIEIREIHLMSTSFQERTMKTIVILIDFSTDSNPNVNR